jgi:hypothetical protein
LDKKKRLHTEEPKRGEHKETQKSDTISEKNGESKRQQRNSLQHQSLLPTGRGEAEASKSR